MGAGFAPGLGQVIWATIAKAVWKPVAALLALLGIYLAGRQDASQRAKSEALEDYKETRERIDNAADFGNDPDAALRWLRERSK
jgi:hypothetical protein